MSLRPHGKATVDPSNPSAFAKCDRCGDQVNHKNLRWQYEWAGTTLTNKRYLVCDTCLDLPNPGLKSIILSADPEPVYNARFEPYAIDEANHYTIRPPVGVPLFRSNISISVGTLFQGPVYTRSANLSASTQMSALYLTKGSFLDAPISGNASMSATAIGLATLRPSAASSMQASVTPTQYYGFANFGFFDIGGV
jgi:hypothetical protein